MRYLRLVVLVSLCAGMMECPAYAWGRRGASRRCAPPALCPTSCCNSCEASAYSGYAPAKWYKWRHVRTGNTFCSQNFDEGPDWERIGGPYDSRPQCEGVALAQFSCTVAVVCVNGQSTTVTGYGNTRDEAKGNAMAKASEFCGSVNSNVQSTSPPNCN